MVSVCFFSFFVGVAYPFRSIAAFAWYPEMDEFSAMSESFPDPLGVGSTLSLGLAVFAEVFCSVGFIFGVFYRLAMIPMAFTMGMAFFVIHGNDPFAVKELAFIYLVVFVLMYITGPGKFSIDHVISSALYKKKR